MVSGSFLPLLKFRSFRCELSNNLGVFSGVKNDKAASAFASCLLSPPKVLASSQIFVCVFICMYLHIKLLILPFL